MKNFQKISLLSLLATVSWKSQVLGGCGSSKVAPIEDTGSAGPAHSYQVKQQTAQTHNVENTRKADTEGGTKSSPKASLIKGVETAGAAAPSAKIELKIEKPKIGAGAEAGATTSKQTLDTRPTREAQAIEPLATTQMQRRKTKQEAATERLSSQGQKARSRTQQSTKKNKVSPAPTLLRSPLQNGRSRGAVGAASVQSKNKKPSSLAPLPLGEKNKTSQLSRRGASPAGAQKPPSSDMGIKTTALVQKTRLLPPLQASWVAATPPEERQTAALPITVTLPAEVSGGLAQARGQLLLKPLLFTPPQAKKIENDSQLSRRLSPPSGPQTPKPEVGTGMGQTTGSPKMETTGEPQKKATSAGAASPLFSPKTPTGPKLLEIATGQAAILTGFTLVLPKSENDSQTPRADSSRPGTARSTLPTTGASPKAEDGKQERENSPKRLKMMVASLKSGKPTSLGESSADLRLYEQALKDPTATTARISTKDFQNNMNPLLDILAASPHLKEVSFEDPFDFVYTGGAGKPDVKISLSDIIERLTGSTSLEILSFHGLPREDQVNDFISNFKSFITKFKTRKFTVIFKGVSPKQTADTEYRFITNSLRTAFTDERVMFKMKE